MREDGNIRTFSIYLKHLRKHRSASISELMALTDHHTQNSKHDNSSQEQIDYDFIANYFIPNGWLVLSD